MEEKEQVKEQEWHHVVTIEDLGGLKRKIGITYDTTGVKMAFDKACETVSKNIQIKGFRKGKAPKLLVEKMCIKEIKKAASSMLCHEGFLHACFEQKISPINEPDVKDPEFNLDGTFTCEMTVEIKPSIIPTGYLGMSLVKPKIEIDNIIGYTIEKLKDQHVTNIPQNEVAEKSFVTVDYWMFADGEQISSGTDQEFHITKGQQPPFGENLIGTKKGEMKLVEFDIPENHPECGGKSGSVKIEVKLIFEKKLPTDEELIERIGVSSYDEFFEGVKKEAQAEVTRRQSQALEEQVIDKLVEMHTFDVPESWVADEEKYLIQQLGIQELDENVKKHIYVMSIRNVKRTFIMEAIYDAEKNLVVTEEEFENLIKKESERIGVSKVKLKSDLKKKGMMDGVLGMMKHKKVFGLIMSQAQIEEEGEEPKIEEPKEVSIPENPLG